MVGEKVEELDKEKMPEHELLKNGLQHLDLALSFIMEMEGAGGSALAHFLHSSLTFGEALLEAIDGQ